MSIFAFKSEVAFQPVGDFANYPMLYRKSVEYAVRDSTELIYQESQRLVPVDTGALKASGKQELVEEGGDIVGYVTYDAPHAMFVETGTGQRGAASAGASPDVTYSATWPGMAAQPYARPALDLAREAILEKFIGRLKEAL
jgi:HK97 gp10 family phage protein